MHKNGRYFLSSQSLWFRDIIKCVKQEEKNLGKKIKTKLLGPYTLGIARLFNPELKHIIPFLNQELRLNGEPASVELEF